MMICGWTQARIELYALFGKLYVRAGNESFVWDELSKQWESLHAVPPT